MTSRQVRTDVSPSCDLAEPLLRPRAGARGLDLTVTRRRVRDELGEQPARGVGDLVDRTGERLLVRARRLREAADLADVLESGLTHLLLGGRRLEVVQRADVPAHGRLLSGRF